MAGKMQDETDDQWDQKTIHAYGEGFEHRQKDTALNNPITDNPLVSATPEYNSWIAGWNAADTGINVKPCVAAPNRVAPV